MTDTNPSLNSENNEAIPEQRTSPWVMLITMLLLISAFMLTSVMLLHYAADRSGADEGTGQGSFSELVGNVKAWLAEAKATGDQGGITEEPTDAEKKDSMVKKLFSGRDDGTVRWPKLKLTGFGSSADEEAAFAVINGKHILVNTYIDEVKLVEIRSQGAVVEYRGEQKYLTVEHAR